MLVFNLLRDRGIELKNLELTLKVVSFSELSEGKREIDKRPNAIYIIDISVDNKFFSFGVKSDGNVDFEHMYDAGSLIPIRDDI